jgi:hypothetical protein
MITDDFGSGEGNNKTIFSATVDNNEQLILNF